MPSPSTLHNNDRLLASLAHVRVEAFHVLVTKEELALAKQHVAMPSVAPLWPVSAQQPVQNSC